MISLRGDLSHRTADVAAKIANLIDQHYPSAMRTGVREGWATRLFKKPGGPYDVS